MIVSVLILLGLPSISSARQLTEDDWVNERYSVHQNFKYNDVWQSIIQEDYEEAYFLLSKEKADSADDEMYQSMIKLFIAIREKDKEMQRYWIHSIEDDAESLIDE